MLPTRPTNNSILCKYTTLSRHLKSVPAIVCRLLYHNTTDKATEHSKHHHHQLQQTQSRSVPLNNYDRIRGPDTGGCMHRGGLRWSVQRGLHPPPRALRSSRTRLRQHEPKSIEHVTPSHANQINKHRSPRMYAYTRRKGVLRKPPFLRGTGNTDGCSRAQLPNLPRLSVIGCMILL